MLAALSALRAQRVPNACCTAERIVSKMEHDDQNTELEGRNAIPPALGWCRYKNTTFGERLREERARLGMTQDEMAEVGGVGRTTQHIYEQDIRAPNLGYLDLLRNRGADLSYLVLGVRHVVEAADAIPLNPQTLSNVYRLVDEVGVDTLGQLLPLEARVRVFQVMCASLKAHGATPKNLDALRKELASFRIAEDLPPG